MINRNVGSTKDENDDIEVISTHDDRVKLVGEIFGNDSSRKILNLLNTVTEMSINEISQNTGLSLALVTHHIKRMQSAQLVKVSRIGKSIKGNEMKYYSATNQSILIVPSKEPEQSVVDSLKKFSKFVAIGLAGFVSWVTVRPDSNTVLVERQPHGEGIDSDSDSLVIDEWSSASEPSVHSDEEFLLDSTPEPEPEPEPELQVDAEPTHSGVEITDFSDSNAIPTGSVTLDRTVYPEPFSAAGTESGDLFLSILIPIVVVACGIILERVLSSWYKKRKQNKIVSEEP